MAIITMGAIPVKFQRYGVRARHKTPTSPAPADSTAAAHAATVAPVVTRSSTKYTRQPPSHPPDGSNTPRTLSARFRWAVSDCGGVRTRFPRARTVGTPVRADTPSASSSAWLNPRRRRADGCIGTGTNTVRRARSTRDRNSCAIAALASCSSDLRRPNLTRRASSRTASFIRNGENSRRSNGPSGSGCADYCACAVRS